MTCPACGEPASAGARYCAACGHDLRHRGDERRVVTVLFADLVGFTTLSETRDPEQVKNLVDRCFERLVADIGAFDGRVDKIIGDAIVALFGAPVAHEDDAERAVRAALQMQRTLIEAAAQAGADLRIRIGINTGEVLVGALRAGGDYTAMGDVVNTASRLQTAAAPGQVLVGAATYAATRNVVRYTDLGSIQAKGREEPVEAWVAEEALLPPGYRPNRLRAPLVGRDPEVRLLSQAVDAAVARSRAQLLLVVAEAGMGKTRLAEEVAAQAECNHNAAVLEGRCVPYGEANVWWPVAEALRYGCSIAASDPPDVARAHCIESVAAALGTAATAAEVERIATGLLYLMDFDGPLRDIDPVRAREEGVRSVLTFLDAAARRRPVVIVLSDLHWADDQVLDLLDTLLERVATQRVVVIATARHTLEERWTPKSGRHNTLVLNLDPLDRDAAGTLLASLLESEVAPEIRDLLLDRSGGNPFFLEELVSLLSETGMVGGEHLGRGDLPDTLRGLVAARLDALTPDERRTLGDAAVLGRRGSINALEIMAEHAWGVKGIAAVVDGLVSKEILVVDDGRWSFRSDLVREVTYGTLTKADRARRHAGIAKWMEQFEAHSVAVVDRIAYHYGVAAAVVAELGPVDGTPDDLRERAITWLERAADQAEAGDHHVVGARLFERAIDLEDEPGPRRQRLLLGRARALAQLRELAPAREDVERALVEAEASGEDRAIASALLVLGDIEQKEGNLEQSATTLDRAATMFRELGDDLHTAEALRNYGMTAMFADRHNVAQRSFVEALDLFRRAENRRGEAWALQNLAWLAYSTGRVDEAEGRLNESAATFSEIGDAGGLGWALGLLAFVRFHQGQFEEAEQLGESMLVEARERGDRWAVGMMLVLLSSIRLWTGRAQSAVTTAKEASELFSEMGDRYGGVQALGTWSRALIATGRVEEGFRVLHDAATPTSGDFADVASLFLIAAAVQAGQPDRSPLQPAAEALDEGTIGWVEMLVARGVLLLQQGDAVAARPWLEAAEASAKSTKASNGYACAMLALGLAAGGQPNEAIDKAAEVEGLRAATYSDRAIASIAAGLSYGALGDADGVARTFDATRAAVDVTDDRLTQAIVRLGEAHALQLLGDPRADGVAANAADRLAAMGTTAEGWRTAFGLATCWAAG